eukprot:TRINITY_DN66588_c2_g1_i2.p1 TRINITY_DN66588_c2_g1~~TRINITY_DN66588_c2_g1_i2.p1  ORF type:complete len:159 (+),score=7.13 TRINITY_DN66588_c2_g1_i2:27-503(+)
MCALANQPGYLEVQNFKGGKKCPQGHPLAARTTMSNQSSRWHCDACKQYFALSRGDVPFGCADCDYDLCLACMLGLATSRFCSKGHELHQRESGSWSCDLCGSKGSAGDPPSWCCATCNFDDCGNCSLAPHAQKQQQGDTRRAQIQPVAPPPAPIRRG